MKVIEKFFKKRAFIRDKTRNFSGKRKLLGINALINNSPSTHERKTPQGKVSEVFLLDALKTATKLKNLTQRYTQSGHYFPIFEKGAEI